MHERPIYHMVGDFCGVQSFVDFVGSCYLQKLTEF